MHVQPSTKKIIILSAEMGQGHMSAAKAVQEGLERVFGEEVDVEIVDVMKLMNEKINRISKKTYENLAKSAPYVMNFIFERWNGSKRIKALNTINYPFGHNQLKKFFEEKKPDLIVSTFPVWDLLALKIFRKLNKTAKFVSIITDSVNIHKAWTAADFDYQIVANEETAKSVETNGVPPGKIKTLGFPVRLDFLNKVDRQSFLTSQGLNPEKFTILFLAVSQKRKQNLTIIQQIRGKHPNANIIIICGRDNQSLKNLQQLPKSESLKIIGWTDQMASFIKSSDVIVTKAGGATIMECIAAKKPIIITKTIAKHEIGNAMLVKKYQLGIYDENKKSDISEQIEKIRTHYRKYERNLAKMSHPEAAITIAKFLGKLIS